MQYVQVIAHAHFRIDIGFAVISDTNPFPLTLAPKKKYQMSQHMWKFVYPVDPLLQQWFFWQFEEGQVFFFQTHPMARKSAQVVLHAKGGSSLSGVSG